MREITFLQAMNEALREEMRRDDRVFVMGEDVRTAPFGTTIGLLEEFGKDRVLDTPISEAGFVGASVGAAASGLRPVVDMAMVNFMFVAMDQFVNQAAKMRYMSGGQVSLPVVYVALTGAGGSMAAQHSQSIHPLFMNIPGLKVVFPSTPYDAKGLLKSSIRDDNPVIFLWHFSMGHRKGQVPEEEYLIPLRKGDIKRQGTDVTIFAVGSMVTKALAAADELQKEGISAEVIDPRSLVPMDKEILLSSLKKTGRLVVMDEAHKTCGAAAEVMAIAVEEGFKFLKAPIRRITTMDVPIPFSPPLEEYILPSIEKIVGAVKETLIMQNG